MTGGNEAKKDKGGADRRTEATYPLTTFVILYDGIYTIIPYIRGVYKLKQGILQTKKNVFGDTF